MQKVKLTANILFSGVGFQERGIVDSGVFDLDVLTTSDIDKDAILTYAAIHNGLTQKLVDNFFGYPSIEEMILELQYKNIGYDPKKNKPYETIDSPGCLPYRLCEPECPAKRRLHSFL